MLEIYGKVALFFVATCMIFCSSCSINTINTAVDSPDSHEEKVTTSPEPKITIPEIQNIDEIPNQVSKSLPLEGRLICIDPGHCVTPLTGKGYTELVSPLSNKTKPQYTTGTRGKNLTEEQLNLAVGLKLRTYLQNLGAEVIMTRETSEITITGRERCDIPNEAGADVCIRIHADGFTDPSARGVSVLTPTGELLGTPSIAEESTRLGQLMVDAVANETGAKNRGISPRSDMTGFNFSEVPTVLIEMGFMTNPEEDALLETDEYQDKIVVGIANALMEWYNDS